MKFSSSVVTALSTIAAGAALTSTTTSAFSPQIAFVRSTGVAQTTIQSGPGGCNCPDCMSNSKCHTDCACCVNGGRYSTTSCLFAEVSNEATVLESEAAPVEIQEIDGYESEQEAHNQERINNRGSLKKHKEKAGTALSDLEVGSMVPGKIKSITSYGAFVDIGATTDGLLHISALSNEFVSDVNEVLKEGQSVEVRIKNIDSVKGQVQLTMLTDEEEASSGSRGRQQRSGGGGRGGPSRNEKIAIQSALESSGWDADKMIDGEVVNTLDFGAFVNFDASQLNSEVTGVIDGLCHISCLATGRTNAVSDVVKTGDKVQVRVKSISGGKVALSMITSDEESADRSERRNKNNNDDAVDKGPADWEDQLAALSGDDPETNAGVSKAFVNKIFVVDGSNDPRK